MEFLHDTLEREFGRRAIADTKVPRGILDNLRPGYGRRPYQIEAFQRFIVFHANDFKDKQNKPLHLLYNMATGSGKTLIMAGLILYLYEQGHRNFLFFVNSANIIKKTMDNFLNQQAGKYLFNDRLAIGGRDVLVKQVENFDEADADNINIKFTTIQQLHIDMNNTKENSVTIEDFKNKKVTLIADEAHRLNVATRGGGNLFDNWERTVIRILKANPDNILLEFTATMDYENREIAEKYQNKVIYKYDLAQFRQDKYSKEISLIRSAYNEKERVIQALILNLYRQELAAERNINLKPVILFKAKRAIKESEQNKANFHNLIENFSAGLVKNIQQTSTVPVVQEAFGFFKSRKLSNSDIAKRIQSCFTEQNCLSANNDKDTEKNQILLNTLEDANNPIRAVFAVQKLNEGWDVLNLFDIVRLYEGRDGGANKPGKTTMSEAQLIGRGARYFPFALEEGHDPYTRKFDDDLSSDLKVLEELYYHTREESRYISDLKRALVETGIYEDNLETKQLSLKMGFKKTRFYKTGHVVFNKKVKKNYKNINSFADLGVKKRNFSYTLSSGAGMASGVFTNTDKTTAMDKILPKDIKVKNIPEHVTRFALTQNPFYYYDSIARYFPNVGSISNFIKSADYMGGLAITCKGTKARLSQISHHDYLLAINGLLDNMEAEIKSNLTEYQGSDYTHDRIHNIFKDKQIRVAKGSERADGQLDMVTEADWYVYNANYGTSEEKRFVELFARRFEHLKKKYSDIYLIRNERALKIFDKAGRAFEPDFILFCKKKNGERLTYQVFIEPKGEFLQAGDAWKKALLKEMREEEKTIKIDGDKYLITGVPFYSKLDENVFKEALEEAIGTLHD